MKRTEWLPERRTKKLKDVFGRQLVIVQKAEQLSLCALTAFHLLTTDARSVCWLVGSNGPAQPCAHDG